MSQYRAIAEQLVRQGSPNQVLPQSGFPLMYHAVTAQDEGTVKFLLRSGANPDTPGMAGWRPIHAAAGENFHRLIAVLADGRASLDVRANDGSTALFFAAGRGHLESVRVLLDKGARLLSTPLEFVSSQPCRELLQQRGIVGDPSTLQTVSKSTGLPDLTRGYGALHMACENNDVAGVVLALEQGADPNATSGPKKNPPVQVAARSGHTEIVLKLLQAGANPNVGNIYETTALHSAAGKGHIGAVKALLQFGADPGKRNADRLTASDMAREAGFTEIVRLLSAHAR